MFELLELKKVEAQLSSQHIMQTGEAKATNKTVRSEFRKAATASTVVTSAVSQVRSRHGGHSRKKPLAARTSKQPTGSAAIYLST